MLNEITSALKNIFKRELVILWLFSLLLSAAIITLSLKNKLPLGKGDFTFISILTLLVALYRPRWIFFLFISLIPLENIILVSDFLPLQLRPYQFLEAILVAAIFILWLSKRLDFRILKPNWMDTAFFSLMPLSLLPLLSSTFKALNVKNSLILLSFVLLYFLIRNFVRNKSDLIKTFAFFVGSYLVVVKYGFYQVLADKFGFKSFEVMFGRPNSTFAEPDWLGIFLCFSLAAFLSVAYYLSTKRGEIEYSGWLKFITHLFIFSALLLAILTLSRSTWIGIAIVSIFFIFLIPGLGKEKGSWFKFSYGKSAEQIAIFLIILLISIFLIRIFNLSKFDIFDRARSTATSEQKITVACAPGSSIPESVATADELNKFGCQHINLEDIASYKSRGKMIAQIYRKDPNVMTRSAIYKQSWEIIKKHPITGVGYASITQSLGADERGAGLNESNIFLQIWAGSGLFGLIIFVSVIGFLFVYSFRRISPICPLNKIISCPTIKGEFEKTLNIFLVLGVISLIIPNLFNAGLFMGTFWLGMATVVSAKDLIIGADPL
ncbi:MAG: O-antigen ligase family protein [Parcubacteria group bacterium]|jgi:hypothetical protein